MAQIIRHRRGSLESLSAATASFQKGELIIVSGSSNITSTNGGSMVFAATESGSVQAVNRFIIGNNAPNVFSSSTYNGLVKGVPYYASGSSTLYLLGSDGNDIPDLTGNISNFSASVATSINALSASIGGGSIGNSVSLLNSKTGSYATTGSNVFEGLQHINGTIEIHSGSNPELRLQNTTTGIEYHIQNGDGGHFQIHNGTTNGLLFRFNSGSVANGNQSAQFFGGVIVSQSLQAHILEAAHISASEGFSGSIAGIGNVTAFSSSVDSRFSASVASVTSLSASVASVTGDFSSSVAQTFTTQSQRISSLESFSGSQLTQNTALATVTGSLISSASTAKSTNDTQDGRLSNLETTSASVNISVSNLNSFSSSQLTQNTALATISGSLISSASAAAVSIANLNANSGSYALLSGSNVFYGQQVITGSLYVTQDLIVQGSSSLQYITASAVDLGTNTIILNNDSPSVRFGGISVVDSGSASGTSGSLFWDSLNNNWIYQHPSGGAESGQTAILISGPRNSGSMGSEAHITPGTIMVAVGDDHIGDSIITQATDNSTISVAGDVNVSGSIIVDDTIASTGNLYLQPDVNDARTIQIYNTSVSDTHIKATGGLTFLGDDTNFVKIDDSAQTVTITGVNGVFINNSLDVTGPISASAGFSGSIDGIGNVTAYSSSVSASLAAIVANVGSGVGVSIDNLNSFTQSYFTNDSSSFDTRISNVSSSAYDLSDSLYNLSGSTYSASSSFDIRISNVSSSLYDLSGSAYSVSSSLDTRVSNVSSSVYDLSGSTYSLSSSLDTRITNNSSSISELSGSNYTLSSSFDTRITNNSSSISTLSGSTYNLSSSLDTRITNNSSSISELSGSTYTLSSSLDTRIVNVSSSVDLLSGSVYTLSSSFDTRITNNSSSIAALSASVASTTGDFSSSVSSRLTNLESTSASVNTSVAALNSSSASQQTQLDSLSSKTGSYATTGSNVFYGTQTISGSFNVSGSANFGGAVAVDNSNMNLGNSSSLNLTGGSSIYVAGAGVISGSIVGIGNVTAFSTSVDSRLSNLQSKSASVDASIAALNSYTSSNTSTTALNNFTASAAEKFTEIGVVSGSLISSASAAAVANVNLNSFTQSADGRLTNLESTSASVNTSLFNINSFTESADSRLDNLEAKSASIDISVYNINGATASLFSSIANLNTNSASLNTSIFNINGTTASLNTSVAALNSYSSALKTAFEFTGSNVVVIGDLIVKGNTTSVESNVVQLGDNIIELNGTGAANGGLLVKDPTAPNTVSGSLLWDSTNDYWKAGAAGAESKLLRADGDNVVSGGAQIAIADLDGYADYNDNILLEFSASNASITSLSASVASVTGDFSSSVATSFSASNASITALSASVASVTGDFSSSVATSFSASAASQTALSSSFASSQATQNGRLDNLETTSGSLNSFSSSINTIIKTKLDAETVVSGSSQITIGDTTGFSTFSGSIATSISASVAASTWENLNGKPGGIVSGSSQVDITQTTGFNTFSASIETRISIIDGGTY